MDSRMKLSFRRVVLSIFVLLIIGISATASAAKKDSSVSVTILSDYDLVIPGQEV